MRDRPVPDLRTAALLLVLLAALLGGGTARAATVTLGPAASGRTLQLRAGDVLVVRLPGNPTTGFRWSAVSVPRALCLVGTAYVPARPVRPGRGGTYVFRLAARPGRGLLGLAYARPWERGTPPRQAFRLTVVVR